MNQKKEEYDNINEIKDFLYPNSISNLGAIFLLEKELNGTYDENGYWIRNSKWYKKYSGGPEVVYKFNKDYYRSQHFKNLSDSDINILYAGCSNTFGTGIPEEFIWPTLLSNSISSSKDKNVEHFNIGFPGFGIDIIIKNTMSFIRTFGKPDYIFMMLPDLSRSVVFLKESNRYIKTFVNDWSETLKNKAQKKYIEYYEYENSILKYSMLLNMLEDFCESNNIKLLWTTWRVEDDKVYKSLNFRNYFSPDLNFKMTDPSNQNIFNRPYWKTAEDGGHPGTGWHQYISELYFSRLNINE